MYAFARVVKLYNMIVSNSATTIALASSVIIWFYSNTNIIRYNYKQDREREAAKENGNTSRKCGTFHTKIPSLLLMADVYDAFNQQKMDLSRESPDKRRYQNHSSINIVISITDIEI